MTWRVSWGRPYVAAWAAEELYLRTRMGKSPRPLPAHMKGELDDARAIVMALAAPLWTGARALAASPERAALRSAVPAVGPDQMFLWNFL